MRPVKPICGFISYSSSLYIWPCIHIHGFSFITRVADPVFEKRSDPVFERRSDPDPAFKTWSDPVLISSFKIPTKLNFSCSVIYQSDNTVLIYRIY